MDAVDAVAVHRACCGVANHIMAVSELSCQEDSSKSESDESSDDEDEALLGHDVTRHIVLELVLELGVNMPKSAPCNNRIHYTRTGGTAAGVCHSISDTIMTLTNLHHNQAVGIKSSWAA